MVALEWIVQMRALHSSPVLGLESEQVAAEFYKFKGHIMLIFQPVNWQTETHSLQQHSAYLCNIKNS
jgi:hypothetical protein